MRKTITFVTVIALVTMVLATAPASVSADYSGDVTINADGSLRVRVTATFGQPLVERVHVQPQASFGVQPYRLAVGQQPALAQHAFDLLWHLRDVGILAEKATKIAAHRGYGVGTASGLEVKKRLLFHWIHVPRN